jgi:hypothetical protein
MKLTAMLHQVAAFFHAVADFVRSAPTNVWAMCAFVAAASIMVTLVTLCLWPGDKAKVVPVREPVKASGVRVMATSGVAPADIARRTGLSHDAVATILRASALSRGDRARPRRKSRPSAA